MNEVGARFYVHHDPFRGVRLPQMVRAEQPYFTLEEVREILAASPEPYRTFYWLAAETGLRAGELCGVRWRDIGTDALYVKQSVWRGKTQTTNSPANRSFSAPCRAPVFAARGEFQFAYFPYQERNALGPQLSKETETVSSLQEAWKWFKSFRHGQAMLRRQQRMEHTDPSLTIGTYTHPISADERRFVEELGSRLIQ